MSRTARSIVASALAVVALAPGCGSSEPDAAATPRVRPVAAAPGHAPVRMTPPPTPAERPARVVTIAPTADRAVDAPFATLRGILVDGGLPVHDRTDRLSRASRRGLRDRMRWARAERTARWWAGPGGEVDVLAFDDVAALDRFVRSRADALVHRRTVMLPVGAPAQWEAIAALVTDAGGTRVTPPPQSRAEATLAFARAAVADYLRFYDAPPALDGRTLWDVLIEAGLLEGPLWNPDAPPEVATRVFVATTPGWRGDSVDPDVAGWVWNGADARLYLAGSGK